MTNLSTTSLLDKALELLNSLNKPTNLNDLIDKLFEELNIKDESQEKRTQLYIEITTCGRFVYLGDELWDLKSKHSLKEYVKDAADYMSHDDVDNYEEDDIEEIDDEYLDEESDDYDNYDDFDETDDSTFKISRQGFGNEEDDEYEEIEEEYEDNYDDGDDFDESEYNDLMDDYENMYDK